MLVIGLLLFVALGVPVGRWLRCHTENPAVRLLALILMMPIVLWWGILALSCATAALGVLIKQQAQRERPTRSSGVSDVFRRAIKSTGSGIICLGACLGYVGCKVALSGPR